MDNKRDYIRIIFFGIILLLIALIWFVDKRIDNDNQDKKLAASDKIYKIVIDPGHGGKDVGTTGASGLYEKDFALNLSKKVYTILESEERVEVYMTREEDIFISTIDMYRPEYANEIEADLFISIHGNAFEDQAVSGTESYYYHEKYKSFAEVIHKNVVGSTGFNDRGVKKKDLFVVRYTEMPSVLLEIGYLSNPDDEKLMFDDEFQNTIAESICDGIIEYIEIE